MKALLFSDIHLDSVTAGRPRLSEIQLFLDRVAEIIIAQSVELVLFGGDAHDPGSLLDGLYSSVLIKRFLSIVRTGGVVFVGIAGNHDVIDSSQLFVSQPVTTLTPVRAAALSALPAEYTDRLHILDRPHTRQVLPGYAVLALPYVSRVHAKELPAWEDHAFEQAAKFVKAGCKLIVLGHRVVPGAEMSSESAEMAKGQDMLFPFSRVAALNPTVVLNGHYHKRQVVRSPTGTHDILIPGSPLRFTFGEADQTSKGVVILEL